MRAATGPIISHAIATRFGALLVVLLFMAGASRAQAACGSYVVIGQPGAEAMANGHPMQDEPASRPCTGPQCRAHERTPAAPLSIDHAPAAHDLASLTAARDLPALIEGRSPIRDWTIRSESHLLPIDPPPRA